MSTHIYRLFYTGRVRKVSDSGKTIITQLDGDYMGSSYFEFGAVPKALGNFLNQDNLVFGKVEYEGKLYRYWVREDQAELLHKAIFNHQDTVKELDEPTYPRLFFKGNSEDRCIFCIDEGYECFIYTNKTLTSRLKVHREETARVLKKNGWQS